MDGRRKPIGWGLEAGAAVPGAVAVKGLGEGVGEEDLSEGRGVRREKDAREDEPRRDRPAPGATEPDASAGGSSTKNGTRNSPSKPAAVAGSGSCASSSSSSRALSRAGPVAAAATAWSRKRRRQSAADQGPVGRVTLSHKSMMGRNE